MNNKKEINVKNLSVFFSGSQLYFGTMEKNNLFVDIDKTFGQYLDEEQINANFRLRRRAVMVLKDAIEGDAYGKEINLSFSNAGLTFSENCYLKSLYEKGSVSFLELKYHQAILSKKISSRLISEEAEREFHDGLEQLNKSLVDSTEMGL